MPCLLRSKPHSHHGVQGNRALGESPAEHQRSGVYPSAPESGRGRRSFRAAAVKRKHQQTVREESGLQPSSKRNAARRREPPNSSGQCRGPAVLRPGTPGLPPLSVPFADLPLPRPRQRLPPSRLCPPVPGTSLAARPTAVSDSAAPAPQLRPRRSARASSRLQRGPPRPASGAPDGIARRRLGLGPGPGPAGRGGAAGGDRGMPCLPLRAEETRGPRLPSCLPPPGTPPPPQGGQHAR
ncbi:PREDICTED: basic proline-rich protein-like [Pseudopodoces humilis]|uniref:basic proline-rich protein-like n=1 Tax=Pseudopodoces humilis TaxID=181119 RepID=UPI00039575AA|nr:PREDICTED: basic proline-rich protein-like [Pseudopodoces humilis]